MAPAFVLELPDGGWVGSGATVVIGVLIVVVAPANDMGVIGVSNAILRVGNFSQLNQVYPE
jgi:hypothetical protein